MWLNMTVCEALNYHYKRFWVCQLLNPNFEAAPQHLHLVVEL